MDKIIPSFETTLFDSTLKDACMDMAELGIDSLLDDGVFEKYSCRKPINWNRKNSTEYTRPQFTETNIKIY